MIYEAFLEGKLEAPRHLARTVHNLYFERKYEEFRPRTIWSLSNAMGMAEISFVSVQPINLVFSTCIHELVHWKTIFGIPLPGSLLGLDAPCHRYLLCSGPTMIAP